MGGWRLGESPSFFLFGIMMRFDFKIMKGSEIREVSKVF